MRFVFCYNEKSLTPLNMAMEITRKVDDIINNLSWGKHICQFYNTKEDLADILVPYFKAGLENNELCMWVTSEPLRAEDAKKALKKDMKNLDKYIRKGQLVILEYSKWYTRTGRFNPDKVLKGWGEKEREALKRGFSGLRVTGNISWLEKKDWRRFIDYEGEINRAINGNKIIAICTYCINECSMSEIIEVVSNHQHAIIKQENRWGVIDNSLYEDTYRLVLKKAREIENIFYNAPIGLGYIDADLKLIRINPFLEQMFNIKSEEVKSRYCYDVLGIASKDKTLKEKNRICDECEVIKTLKDGKIHTHERKIRDDLIIKCTSFPIRDENGVITGAIKVIDDISKRKQTERKLQESEEKYRTMVEYSNDLIWTLDKEGNFTFINKKAEEVSGYKMTELKGKSFVPLIVPEDLPRVMKIFSETMGGKTQQYEVDFYKKNKSICSLSVNTTPVVESGNVIATVSFGHDITERKQIIKNLERSQEEMRNLTTYLQNVREKERMHIAREIHDELGQALTAIKIDASWLSKKSKDKVILDKTESMIQLIDQTIASVQKISSELRPGILDDLGLISAIEWQAGEFSKRTGIKCVSDIKEADISLDQTRSTAIFRIFQESLTNIARHSKATKVNIMLKQKDDRLVLKISDNGRGISREKINSPKSYGILGMRERVIYCGGEITINRNKGKGTTVTLSIPIERRIKRQKHNTKKSKNET